MKLKTYEAPTLHAALRLARIELGSEAVLLEAKENNEETSEARFHVTFALGAEADALAAEQPSRLEMPHWKTYLPKADQAPEKNEPDVQAAPETPEPEIKPKAKPRATRRKTAPAKRKKAARQPKPKPADLSAALHDSLSALRTPELAALFGRLVAAGVSAGEASSLCGRAAETTARDDDAQALEAALVDILGAGWRIHDAPEPAPKATRVLALAGPSGAGKSATAIKLASLLIRAYDRPASLISLGRHPIGGVEALEAWATLLQLRLDILEAPAELPPILERLAAGPHPPGAIILDLPSAWAESLPGLETHLVLPATYSTADLCQAIERYRSLDPVAAIFTRLDEAAAPGALWELQRFASLPVSYLGCGPNPPGDLQPATPRRITQRLLKPETFLKR